MSDLPKAILAKLASIGLVKGDRIAVNKTLENHLADYTKALAAKGNTEKHTKHVKGRIERAFKGCGFKYWDDISASKLQVFLDKLRKTDKPDSDEKRGISPQTFNYYLNALKAFCRWMVKDRRAISSPLSHLDVLNTRVDRRHDRRALGNEDLRKLMRATRDGRDLFGRDRDGIIVWQLSGLDRSVLYQLAVETGLRAGELRSLTPQSFSLGSGLSTVKVLAAYSKHRRDDTLPLRPATAAMLGEYLLDRDPEKPVFQLPRREEIASVLRVDLEAAGIPYRDNSGLVVDFHALRHTFITNLAQGGVHPKTAQALARHSTITLTMDRYSHSERGDEAKALESLPDLSDASGSPDTDPDEESVSAVYLAQLDHLGEPARHSERLNGQDGRQSRSTGKQDENADSSDISMAPVGVEPTRPITGQRILSPLRLPISPRGRVGRVYGRWGGCGWG